MLNLESKSTKQRILEKTFEFLIKNGLEKASIRNICKYTGLSMGAITYYYPKKNDMLCAAVEYGLKKMSGDIFSYFFDNIYNIDQFFANFTDSIDYAKKELRFIYQMAASPVYGEMLRGSKHKLVYAYDEYSKRLAKMSGGDIEEIKPILYIFSATVIDYAVWQNKTQTQTQLNYICKLLKGAIGQPETISNKSILQEEKKARAI